MLAFGELLDEFGTKGVEVVGFAAGDETGIDDDFLVDPVTAGVADVRLQGEVRGQAVASGRFPSTPR